MAPVGSREALSAALRAGTDSIYFGIEHLNMRAHSARTFTIDDLKDIASECRHCGVKSYLTVNTIIYGEDLAMMRQILDAALEARISAVIASDVAVMQYCRQIGLEVHLSTQLNISNIEALRFYAQFADVVVLARELNMDQVAEIYRQIVEQHICGPSGELIRIEMFCHGALCMAISGKCYLSLQNMGRSANRGECMQLCRAFGLKETTNADRHFITGYTDALGKTSYESYHSSYSFMLAKGPTTLNYRYLTEDAPYSMVPLSSLAAQLGLKTPLMDAVANLGGALMQTNYWETGRTVEDLGLAGMTLEEMKDFLENGYKD